MFLTILLLVVLNIATVRRSLAASCRRAMMSSGPTRCLRLCNAELVGAEVFAPGGRSRYPAAAALDFGVTLTASLP
jgi:hypothetical protein